MAGQTYASNANCPASVPVWVNKEITHLSPQTNSIKHWKIFTLGFFLALWCGSAEWFTHSTSLLFWFLVCFHFIITSFFLFYVYSRQRRTFKTVFWHVLNTPINMPFTHSGNLTHRRMTSFWLLTVNAAGQWHHHQQTLWSTPPSII